MTNLQKKFVELEKRKEEVKRFFDELAEATEAVKNEIGLNSYFQDDEGTVYKIVEPAGKWITYDKVSYVRTRRITEKRGDLSLKEAEEAGFNVPTK